MMDSDAPLLMRTSAHFKLSVVTGKTGKDSGEVKAFRTQSAC